VQIKNHFQDHKHTQNQFIYLITAEQLTFIFNFLKNFFNCRHTIICLIYLLNYHLLKFQQIKIRGPQYTHQTILIIIIIIIIICQNIFWMSFMQKRVEIISKYLYKNMSHLRRKMHIWTCMVCVGVREIEEERGYYVSSVMQDSQLKPI